MIRASSKFKIAVMILGILLWAAPIAATQDSQPPETSNTESAETTESDGDRRIVTDGASADPPPSPILHNNASQILTHQDVNLTLGSVQLSETDLVLPGKNGHDLVISRSFSSVPYQRHTHNWQFHAGRGWAFSFSMRAFFTTKRLERLSVQLGNNEVIVGIQTPGGLEKYTQTSYDTFKAVTPGNNSKVVIEFGKIPPGGHSANINKINLYTADGKQFIFQNKTHDSTIRLGLHTYDTLQKAFYLSQIKDIHGNTITIHYTGLPSMHTNFNTAPVFQWLRGGKVLSPVGSTQWMRPHKITDTFGREIHLHYEDAHNTNTWGDAKRHQITRISYISTNNTPKTIAYHYDNRGTLTKVDYDGLAQSTYSYDDYEIRADHYPYINFKRGINSEMFEGQLLTEVVSTLGLKTTYEYTECFTGDDAHYNYTIGTISEPNPVQSFPVVSRKIIETAPGDSTEIRYHYPRWTENPNFIRKEKFTPPGADNPAFYFASVTVDYPDHLADETYTFENARLVEHLKGPLKTITEWDYDNLRQNSVTHYRGTAIDSKTTYVRYDDYNNPLEIQVDKGTTPYTRQTIEYDHRQALLDNNLFNLQKTVTLTDLATQKSRITSAIYNDHGQTIATYEGTPANGNQRSATTYDTSGRILTQTAFGPAGPITTQFAYTEGATYKITQTINGKSSSSEYDPATGQPVKSTDVNGNVSTTEYDSHGRPIRMQNPDGADLTTTYPSLHRKVDTFAGRSIETILDNAGQTIEIRRPAGELSTKYVYRHGQRTEKYLGESGNYTLRKTYAYDHLGRPTQVTDIHFGTVTTDYDDLNNTITTTDALGRKTIKTYNELKQLIRSEYVPDGATQTYQYTAFGDLASMTDPNAIIHATDHDNFGRAQTGYAPREALNTSKALDQFSYGPSGALLSTQRLSEDGSIFRSSQLTYDTEGRITQLTINGITEETIQYDGPGPQQKDAVTAIENTGARIETDYDVMGRITQERTTVKPVDATYAMRYEYAENGQLATEILPNDKRISYQYNANHRLDQIRYNNAAVAQLHYAPNGTITKITLGNGTTIDYDYEKEALVTGIQVKTSANEALYTQQITYDPLGKPLTSTHTNLFVPGATSTRNYTYNKRDELATVGIDQSADHYTYTIDKLGNRLQFTAPSLPNSQLNMTYDVETNQLATLQMGVGQLSYTHDPAGNLTQRTLTHSGTATPIYTDTFTYNYQDQLTRIARDNRTIAEYAYDPNRQRIYKKDVSVTPATETLYHWNQNGQILAEASPDTGIHTTYIYLGNEKIAMVKTENNTDTLYFFINTPQGTPVAIIDPNEAIVHRFQQDEFGNIERSKGQFPNEVHFTGKKRDAESGLYYFVQRYYDGTTGRMLTNDPAEQAINPYLFAGNNPLIYVDPDGEFFHFLIPILAGAAISAGINIGLQLATTGTINWGGVGKSALFGGISAGLSFGIGEMGLNGIAKAAAHSVSGGIQSVVGGGNFLQGAAVGGVTAGGQGLIDDVNNAATRVLISAGVGAATAAITGGNVLHGGITGGFQRWFNHESHIRKKILKKIAKVGMQVGVGFQSISIDNIDGLNYNFDLNPQFGFSSTLDFIPDGMNVESVISIGYSKFHSFRIIRGKLNGEDVSGFGFSFGLGIQLIPGINMSFSQDKKSLTTPHHLK